MSTAGANLEVSRGSNVLAAGYDYESVTDKISDIVLKRKSGRAWRFSFALAALFVLILTAAVSYLFLRGHLGHRYSSRVGIRHRQFCLVDRHWSRRNFH